MTEFAKFSKSLTTKLFTSKEDLPVKIFENNLNDYCNWANIIFRKQKEILDKDKITLRCYYFNKNSKNKKNFPFSCKFKLSFKRNGDNITILEINHEHNHCIMDKDIFEELKEKNKLQFMEKCLKDWMQIRQGYNSIISLSPKNIRKLLEKDNSLHFSIEKDDFMKKKFDDIVNKLKKEIKNDTNEIQ